MGRVIGLLLAFLGIGLAANMLVAWGAVLGTQNMQLDVLAVAAERRELWASGSSSGERWLNQIWRARGITLRFLHEQGDRTDWIVEHRAGWPFHAVRGRVRSPESPGRPVRFRGTVDCGGEYEMAIYVASQPQPLFTDTTARAFPLIPIWSGVALNTLFYVVVLFVPIAVVFSTRRAIRRAKGRCPACGYILLNNDRSGCPECGWKRTRGHSDDTVRSLSSEAQDA